MPTPFTLTSEYSPLTPEQERIKQLFSGDPTANIAQTTAPTVTNAPISTAPKTFQPTPLTPIKPVTDYQKAMRNRLQAIIQQGQNATAKYYKGGGYAGALNYSGIYKGNDARSRLLRVIAAQAGVPYSWGGGSTKGATYGIGRGANTKGFDCSGLVLYAYSKIGIRMPRLAEQQALMGRRTSIRNLRPGDLVAGPGHIAVYAGNGMMWEAPRTGLAVRLTRVRAGMVGVALRI